MRWCSWPRYDSLYLELEVLVAYGDEAPDHHRARLAREACRLSFAELVAEKHLH